MKLFKATITITTVVGAEDAIKATRYALSNMSEIVDGSNSTLKDIEEITSAEQLPRDWDVKCLPYGLELIDENTIENLLK